MLQEAARTIPTGCGVETGCLIRASGQLGSGCVNQFSLLKTVPKVSHASFLKRII